MTSIFTKRFWKDSAERSIKSAAQGALLAVGASNTGPANLFNLNAKVALGFAAGAAAVSLLTSIVSAPLGDEGSASIVHLAPEV